MRGLHDIAKSLLTPLCQREGNSPSLAKRGEGRFFNNDALLMNSLMTVLQMISRDGALLCGL